MAITTSSVAVGQFTIGVWQPGGHVEADTSFTATDVDSLTALDIDLLNTPPVNSYSLATTTQDFEESIMAQWDGHGGFVVHKAPEGIDRYQWWWQLESWAGRYITPLTLQQRNYVGAAVDALVAKWGGHDAFYGYRVGHEYAPNNYGIYNSMTYQNLVTVIDSIRADDTTRRILAIGNVRNMGSWGAAAQDSFRAMFFRPADPDVPANILMHEDYRL